MRADHGDKAESAPPDGDRVPGTVHPPRLGPSTCERAAPKFFVSPVRVGLVFVMVAVVFSFTGKSADAAGPPPVGLGTAANFAVLGGSEVTNTGPTTVIGDVGVSPGTAVTGFPPGTVNGTVHAADAVAAQAKTDLTTAYDDAAGRAGAASVSGDLGGQTLTAGLYRSTSSLELTGTLTLDAQGDGNAVFIFQAGSALTTASASRVSLIGGADACNVFWQVGSTATLGTNSVFKGTILALTSITATTGTTIDGRTLARNGAATLDTNTITRAACPTASPTATTGPGGGTTATTGPGGATTATTGPGGGTTASTGPGSPTLPRSGTGSGAGLALVGAALTMTGGTVLLVARRQRQTAYRR